MRNILKLTFLSVFVTVSVAFATDDIGSLCNNKHLSCSDLNYNMTTAEKNSYLNNFSGGVCSPCPLTHSSWTCAQRGLSVVIEQIDSLSPHDYENIPVCDVFPSCYDLGYRLTAEQVGNVDTSRSCSACPFDGTKWACAGQGGLVKVN